MHALNVGCTSTGNGVHICALFMQSCNARIVLVVRIALVNIRDTLDLGDTLMPNYH